MWFDALCCHKPKLKNDIFLQVYSVVQNMKTKKTNEIVREELLNSIRETNVVEESAV